MTRICTSTEHQSIIRNITVDLGTASGADITLSRRIFNKNSHHMVG